MITKAVAGECPNVKIIYTKAYIQRCTRSAAQTLMRNEMSNCKSHGTAHQKSLNEPKEASILYFQTEVAAIKYQ